MSVDLFNLSAVAHKRTPALQPSEPVRSVYEPSFCFLAQGSKRALIGGEIFRYDPSTYLIFTVDLPVAFQVDQASEEQPYLGLRLGLDPTLVASVVMESDVEIKKEDASTKAMNVSAVDADLLDAVLRLVRLVETPTERKVLAPLITREIIYRLLIGGQGARLSHILASGRGHAPHCEGDWPPAITF